MNIAALTAAFTLCAAIAGAVIAAEDRYAHKAQLSLKAGSEAVQALQVHIISDKIDDLSVKKFMLDQKPVKTELDNYMLDRIKSRLEQTKITLEALKNGH